jgi:hypothetical protein
MIGENLNAQKPLLTKTSLEQNDAERGCQLWQAAENLLSHLKRKANLGNHKQTIFKYWNADQNRISPIGNQPSDNMVRIMVC